MESTMFNGYRVGKKISSEDMSDEEQIGGIHKIVSVSDSTIITYTFGDEKESKIIKIENILK